MSVLADSLGGDLYYQWSNADGAIAGATSNTYTHPTSPEGTYQYTVDVSNGMGSKSSETVSVVVEKSFTHSIIIETAMEGPYRHWGYADHDDLVFGTLNPGNVSGLKVLRLSAKETDIGGSTSCSLFLSGNLSNTSYATITLPSGNVYRASYLFYDFDGATSFSFEDSQELTDFFVNNVSQTKSISLEYFES